jgi:hypothetical protein
MIEKDGFDGGVTVRSRNPIERQSVPTRILAFCLDDGRFAMLQSSNVRVLSRLSINRSRTGPTSANGTPSIRLALVLTVRPTVRGALVSCREARYQRE